MRSGGRGEGAKVECHCCLNSCLVETAVYFIRAAAVSLERAASQMRALRVIHQPFEGHLDDPSCLRERARRRAISRSIREHRLQKLMCHDFATDFAMAARSLVLQDIPKEAVLRFVYTGSNQPVAVRMCRRHIGV